ncbi:MAG: arginine--tRNA ligase [Candidatus Pacebacteria bacterium]|nr:arginine--tRNA ligase [Candidatus Paceibacterota bacterium]
MINKEIKEILDKIVGDLYQDIKIPDFVVEWPKQKDFGDYALNVAMVLAKELKKSPMEIAREIMEKIKAEKGSEDLFKNITIANPGFINFEISDKYLTENLNRILKRKCKSGSSEMGKGKTVVIDYSAPNIAKPMHVGHLRSTIIGQSLYNIYSFLGYKVIGDNHIGDWGTQFGKLIYAYKNWGDKKKISKSPIEEMTKLYVRFHKESEVNENLEELARKETKRLQDKNAENIKLWKFLVKESLKDYNKIYKTLNVKFDLVLGESSYDDMLSGIVNNGLEKKIASKSEGAIVINLDKYNLSPFLIQKTDGAFLYTTTDIATAKYREEKLKADKVLYVVANEQALHFQKLFASSELLGICENVEIDHIKFGMVLGESGKKFSTRKGDTVRLNDLIRRAIEFAGKAVEEKNPKLSRSEKKKIAKTVGIGAIKYNDLSQNRLTDITFDWDKMLSFEGNSAPYLQYTYARINSLIGKFKNLYKLDRINPFEKTNFDLLKEKEEISLMRHLIKFPEAIENSARENGPHLVALYIYELASLYNSYYNSVQIVSDEKQITKARVTLSKSVSITIRNGLSLLGIDVLDRM